MEAILWKLRTGTPWRDAPKEFFPWRAARDFGQIFLSYEAKLIANGYSPTEAMFALTSMQAALGVAKHVPSENLAEAPG